MVEEINLEKEYKKINKNNSLPSFSKLDSEFEISSIKEKEHLTKSLRRKVNEKIIFYCRILEGILFPMQANIITIHEGKHFSEEDKVKMTETYKKLMQYERRSLILDISPNKKEDVAYINEVFKNWKKFKDEVLIVAKKMQEAWNQKETIEANSYTG
jgi:hypothetical protein